MSVWPSTKAKKVLAALKRIGWKAVRQPGTAHLTLARKGWANVTWAFHDGVELGPKMLSRVAKQTGLRPSDL